ncbi:MAG: hypothetical protein HQK49_09005 [Oligoflexia bacterium]|nr:hypothetical protein [Oligoflexia bacterium]
MERITELDLKKIWPSNWPKDCHRWQHSLTNGNPATVVDLAFHREITVISSVLILEELKKNLINKFDLSSKNVAKLINRILQIADLYEPTGSIKKQRY